MSAGRISVADIADCAATLAGWGEPVDEVWLLDTELVDEAVRDGFRTGLFGSPEGRPDPTHPALVLPYKYRVLLAATPTNVPVAVVNSGRPPGEEIAGGILVRDRGEWLSLDVPHARIYSPELMEDVRRNLSAFLYARWWATTNKVAKQHGYCQQNDTQNSRSTSHRDIPTVCVVRWRKVEHTRSDGTRDVEWSHRWIVRGHLRHLKDGRVTPVRQYVKGPKGLPLVVKAHIDRLVQ